MFFSGTFTLKSGLAQMAKGGVVMDVTNAEQAKIAEQAGVCFSFCLSTRLLCVIQEKITLGI